MPCRPRSRRLQPTERRLGEAAASTNGYAGYYRSNPPQTFCGVTAAVAPNRVLAAGIFVHLRLLSIVFK